MAARDPSHPHYPSSVRLAPKSLAGVGSTASDDPFEATATTGGASVAKAILHATAPGQPGAPSLLDALRRLREAQAATPATSTLTKAAVKPAAVTAEIEKHAVRKSKKTMRKARAAGHEPAEVAARGFAKYRKHGGKKAVGQWLDAV